MQQQQPAQQPTQQPAQQAQQAADLQPLSPQSAGLVLSGLQPAEKLQYNNFLQQLHAASPLAAAQYTTNPTAGVTAAFLAGLVSGPSVARVEAAHRQLQETPQERSYQQLVALAKQVLSLAGQGQHATPPSSAQQPQQPPPQEPQPQAVAGGAEASGSTLAAQQAPAAAGAAAAEAASPETAAAAAAAAAPPAAAPGAAPEGAAGATLPPAPEPLTPEEQELVDRAVGLLRGVRELQKAAGMARQVRAGAPRVKVPAALACLISVGLSGWLLP